MQLSCQLLSPHIFSYLAFVRGLSGGRSLQHTTFIVLTEYQEQKEGFERLFYPTRTYYLTNTMYL